MKPPSRRGLLSSNSSQLNNVGAWLSLNCSSIDAICFDPDTRGRCFQNRPDAPVIGRVSLTIVKPPSRRGLLSSNSSQLNNIGALLSLNCSSIDAICFDPDTRGQCFQNRSDAPVIGRVSLTIVKPPSRRELLSSNSSQLDNIGARFLLNCSQFDFDSVRCTRFSSHYYQFDITDLAVRITA